MVAQERINVCETVGRKNNCKLNFFSMYFVQNIEEIHLSFKNSRHKFFLKKIACTLCIAWTVFSPIDSEALF